MTTRWEAASPGDRVKTDDPTTRRVGPLYCLRPVEPFWSLAAPAMESVADEPAGADQQ